MLRVWGRASAANVQKVLWTAGELELPFDQLEFGPEFDPVWKFDAAPGKAPEVRGIQASDAAYLVPKGNAVPMFDDDGFVLWEGNTMSRYLAAKYGKPPFWPESLEDRCRAERWMDYQLSTARVHIHPLMQDGPPTQKEIEFHSVKLAEVFNTVEVTLEHQDYLVGDDFTVGDIPIGIVVFRWMVLDIKRPRMLNIERWYKERLVPRPAFQKWIHMARGGYVGMRESEDANVY